MLKLEPDRLLEYLATGEDEDLVLQALPLQKDPLRLLDRARAALDALAPKRIDDRVLERLEGLEDAVLKHRRRKTRLQEPPALRVAMSAAADTTAPDDPAEMISRAIAAGERGKRSVGEVVLSEPCARLVPGAHEGFREDDDLPSGIVREASGYFAGPAPPIWSADVADVGHVELLREERAGAPWLVVHLRRGDGQPDANRLVTWLPEAGAVAQAFTDKAGIARLPWPSTSAGLLRLDAAHTVELKIRVPE